MAFRASATLLALGVMLSACSSARREPPPRPAGSGDLVQLNVITSPVGLDLDGRPGLDGFSVKVYANAANQPKPVAIRSGTLEILMFDGTFYGRSNVPPPLRVWTFSGRELRAQEFSANIGTGYEFLLAWGPSRPSQRLITVAARHTSPGGAIITSRPSSVTVIDR